MQYSLNELLHPEKEDTRTGEEITEDFCKKSGIVIEEE